MSDRMKKTVFVMFLSAVAYDALVTSSPARRSGQSRRVKRWEDFPDLPFTFDCRDRPVGFYADKEHNCQIFHMCDEDGRRFPHICANETGFNQEFRICDWDYNFNCEDADKWYYLNELTYATDAPKQISSEINSHTFTENYSDVHDV